MGRNIWGQGDEMIKKAIKKVLSVLLKPVYNVKFINAFNNLHNYLVWGAYAAKLKHIGNNSRVGKFFIIHGEGYIEIGDNFRAGHGLILEAWDEYESGHFNPNIHIGDNVVFTDYDHISCIDHVTIGDGTLLGRNVYISDNSHGRTDMSAIGVPPARRKLDSKGPVMVGDNVWIGRCTTILSGVDIGDNCIIGANSVVTGDIPANCVAAGCPAKVIKRLDAKLDKEFINR